MNGPDLKVVGSQDEPPASAGGGDNGNPGHGERLAALESELKHLATKKDISDIKVWVLSGVIGGMLAAAGLTVVIVKAFLV